MGATSRPEIWPQPGPQEAFLASPADIAIYGGAAGGGKTWALLLEPLRHLANPDFGAVIFRREATQITNEGGLWDEAAKLYPLLGGQSKQVPRPIYHFGTRARVSFAHLNQENDVLDWQGADPAHRVRRAHPLLARAVLLHALAQPLDLRRAPLRPRHLQPRRRQLGR